MKKKDYPPSLFNENNLFAAVPEDQNRTSGKLTLIKSDGNYVCDDWDQKNKAVFDAWAVAKAKQAGFEFTPYEIGAEDVDE